MDKFVFIIYKYLASPLVISLLSVIKLFVSGKLHETIVDKQSQFTQFNTLMNQDEIANHRPIWIHAASGEIEYARPLIRELKKKYPATPILVTYSSPSAKKILSGISEIDVWTALPWERANQIRHFIKKWNPRMLLFSRTDVWPVLADTCAKDGLPMLLFSATFAANSSRFRGLSFYLNRYALNSLDKILCVDKADNTLLKNFKIKTPVIISGDTRFDQVFYRLVNPKPLKSELMPSPEDFVFICGSTWPEDEAVLLPTFLHLIKEGVKIVIAPHETQTAHLEQIQSTLKKSGVNFCLYSQAEKWEHEVLLVDQIGILAELYTWSDIAFIGGSFKKQVHSVMEALAAGLPILVGPHHHNNREALYFKKQRYLSGLIVQEVYTPKDVETLVLRALTHSHKSLQIKEDIRAQTMKLQHATALTLAESESLSLLDTNIPASGFLT